jgi:hypothetical protein
MHYHCEIHLEEIHDLEKQIAEIMAPFEEENNDNGFWDWYQIGGRYTGRHGNYDPEADPANIEVCTLCQGTGFRNDPIGQIARKEDPTYTCNGCGQFDSKSKSWKHSPQGPGKRVKWPTTWIQHSSNVIPVSETSEDLTCYTLIMNGKAYQQAVWNGNEFAKTDFDGKVLPMLKKLGKQDGYLVTVDYHS